MYYPLSWGNWDFIKHRGINPCMYERERAIEWQTQRMLGLWVCYVDRCLNLVGPPFCQLRRESCTDGNSPWTSWEPRVVVAPVKQKRYMGVGSTSLAKRSEESQTPQKQNQTKFGRQPTELELGDCSTILHLILHMTWIPIYESVNVVDTCGKNNEYD